MQPASGNFADSANMSFYGELVGIFREAQTTATPTKKVDLVSGELREKIFEDLRAFSPNSLHGMSGQSNDLSSPRMLWRTAYPSNLGASLRQVIKKFVFEAIASLTPQQNGFIQERFHHHAGRPTLSC